MSRFEEVDFSSLNDTVHGLFHQGNEIWRYVAISARKLLEDLLSFRSLEDVTESISQRPFLAAFVIAMALSCGIPILLFTLFACLTVLMTFTGFLVIEGAILTIGSVFLCGFILAMMIVLLSLNAVIAVAYFGLTEMFGLIQSNKEQTIAQYAPSKAHCPHEQLMSVSLAEPVEDHED